MGAFAMPVVLSEWWQLVVTAKEEAAHAYRIALVGNLVSAVLARADASALSSVWILWLLHMQRSEFQSLVSRSRRWVHCRHVIAICVPRVWLAWRSYASANLS